MSESNYSFSDQLEEESCYFCKNKIIVNPVSPLKPELIPKLTGMVLYYWDEQEQKFLGWICFGCADSKQREGLASIGVCGLDGADCTLDLVQH